MSFNSALSAIPPKNGKRAFISTWVRLVLFFAWSVLIILLWVVRRIFVKASYSAVVAARYSRLWSRGTLRLMDLKLKIRGTAPAAPYFLVTNHLGYLDIAVLGSTMDCTFVAKSQVANWPLFGPLATLSGTLFINRESMRDTERVNQSIAKHFSMGGSLVLFPEGTSSKGECVLPFRPSLLNYPCAHNMSVHSAALKYQTHFDSQPASEVMCWWGEMTLWPHLIKLFGTKGLQAEINFSPVTIYCSDRKELAAKLQGEVSKRLIELSKVKPNHNDYAISTMSLTRPLVPTARQ